MHRRFASVAFALTGLVGLLVSEPVGSYVYEKDGFVCHVIVFLMNVTSHVDNYPENSMRQRLWLPLSQSLNRVEDAGLRDILRGVALSRAG